MENLIPIVSKSVRNKNCKNTYDIVRMPIS